MLGFKILNWSYVNITNISVVTVYVVNDFANSYSTSNIFALLFGTASFKKIEKIFYLLIYSTNVYFCLFIVLANNILQLLIVFDMQNYS